MSTMDAWAIRVEGRDQPDSVAIVRLGPGTQASPFVSPISHPDLNG
jgi:hypothetical protein